MRRKAVIVIDSDPETVDALPEAGLVPSSQEATSRMGRTVEGVAESSYKSMEASRRAAPPDFSPEPDRALQRAEMSKTSLPEVPRQGGS
jgi:hypothetical protein